MCTRNSWQNRLSSKHKSLEGECKRLEEMSKLKSNEIQRLKDDASKVKAEIKSTLSELEGKNLSLERGYEEKLKEMNESAKAMKEKIASYEKDIAQAKSTMSSESSDMACQTRITQASPLLALNDCTTVRQNQNNASNACSSPATSESELTSEHFEDDSERVGERDLHQNDLLNQNTAIGSSDCELASEHFGDDSKRDEGDQNSTQASRMMPSQAPFEDNFTTHSSSNSRSGERQATDFFDLTTTSVTSDDLPRMQRKRKASKVFTPSTLEDKAHRILGQNDHQAEGKRRVKPRTKLGQDDEVCRVM